MDWTRLWDRINGGTKKDIELLTDNRRSPAAKTDISGDDFDNGPVEVARQDRHS